MNIYETEYLRFITHQPPDRKTLVVKIHNRRSGVLLGEIKWFGVWRQYCFFPALDTVFNYSCLADIRTVINELMEQRDSSQQT